MPFAVKNAIACFMVVVGLLGQMTSFETVHGLEAGTGHNGVVAMVEVSNPASAADSHADQCQYPHHGCHHHHLHLAAPAWACAVSLAGLNQFPADFRLLDGRLPHVDVPPPKFA